MTPTQLEAWVLGLADQAIAGSPTEDVRVELKANWPSADRAARRLAGHANSLRSEYLLWIVGIDEKGRAVTGAAQNELSIWMSQIAAHFDGVVPELIMHSNVPYGEKIIVALLFEASRYPYVIKNSAGGAIQREVPWRIGTEVRSATREQLIRMLAPQVTLPEIELLEAEVARHAGAAANSLTGRFNIYIEPRSVNRVVLPYHRMRLDYRVGETPDYQRASQFRFQMAKDLIHAVASYSELVLDGPTLANLTIVSAPLVMPPEGGPLRLRFAFTPSMATDAAILTAEIPQRGSAPFWKFERESSGAA